MIGRELIHDPSLSRLEKAYVRVFGIPINGLRIRARRILPLVHSGYRAILDSDIVHVRRADGKGVDAMLHVNPRLEEKGLAMVYNPTPQPIATQLKLPLYYAGLIDEARIREQNGEAATYTLDRQYNADLEVYAPAKGITWFVVE